MTTHVERTLEVAGAVTERARRNRGFASLKKAGVSHFVPDPRDPRHDDDKIDVSSLRHILLIDVEARVCIAEPGVTFRELVQATLEHGLVPRMVPELETITIGGAVAGCAVESMAYKYGGFHDSCTEYEVITGTGDVVRCSRKYDPELFGMMHGSYGTLGIITELTFELVVSKPFVHMQYLSFGAWPEFRAAMAESMKAPDVDFIDAIAHAQDRFVLCLGRFCDAAPGEPSSYRRTEIFYRSTLDREHDYLSTHDYFFRYDTDCHWSTQTFPWMGTKWGRRLLGRFMLGSTNLLGWSRTLRPLFKLQKNPPVVTDLFIPEAEVDAFYAWYERTIGYYPLWLVPYRVLEPYPWLRADHSRSDLYFDVAIYGLPDDGTYSELLEQKTFAVKGIKTLISQNHYDEATFWKVYDRERYERVKRRMDPSNLFRGLYEKMVRPLTPRRRTAASVAKSTQSREPSQRQSRPTS
jgi:FAD/FMN-containing dehydrogenase